MTLVPKIKMGLSILLSLALAAGLVLPLSATASAPQDPAPGISAASPASPAAPSATSLSVQIVSTPWAVLDSNDPAGAGGDTPNVFVVQAEITNTGAETATNVQVMLDYMEDSTNGWVLVQGETPGRTVDELPAGESYQAYWFARYSTQFNASHYYEVSASADNAPTVTTGHNSWGDPETGKTIKTRSYISTGSSGVTQTSYSTIVGVTFTIQVTYDLGSNPIGLIVSPIGNPDFNAGAYRLLSTSVRFYNDAGTQQSTVLDQLYFTGTDMPAFAENAEATFTFLAQAPDEVRMCAYAAVDYASTDKYDQFYCSENKKTVIRLSGTVEMELDKQVNRTEIQQGETLGYTIQYTKTGTANIVYAWIWDDVPATTGSIETGSITPAPDPLETSTHRAAWYLGDIGAEGSPGSAGTMTFSALIDGGGQNLPDGFEIVNQAYFGVNPGTVPSLPAMTSAVTTTVRAPNIQMTKTDGLSVAEPGDTLDYSLQITNTGSLAATQMKLTDTLPELVDYLGAVPPPDQVDGRTLVWNLSDLAPAGGSLFIQVQAAVQEDAPVGTPLVNSASLAYRNPFGWAFNPAVASDTTTVTGADMEIVKSDDPDPVLVGGTLTYTLTYTNHGPAEAHNLLITDTLPTEVVYGGLVSQPGALSGPDIQGQTLSWEAASLAAGASGSIVYTVTVGATDSAVILNRVAIEAGNYDPDLENNRDRQVTALGAEDRATIYGFVFEDSNGNGVQEDEEAVIPGVTVTLDGSQTTQTNALGIYAFQTDQAGPHTVVETDPAGYFSTTPNEVHLEVALGESYAVDFGDAPEGSAEFTAITGTVFEDLDGDGVFDPYEIGLAGVTVTLDGTQTAVTGPYGAYSFSTATTGVHSVVETDPAGYFSTTPNEVHLDAILGQGYAVDFGDAPEETSEFAAITGTVFEDLDGDGVFDLGEVGLSDITVILDGSKTAITGPYGTYTFSTVTAGNHTVVETDPAGYFSTTPNEVHPAVALGESVTVNFGDAPDSASEFASITGTVFEDLDGDGVFDPEEIGLSGVTVTLDGAQTAVTNPFGNYTFSTALAGVHTLIETDPAGYISTTPNEVHLDVQPGQSYPVNFGDAFPDPAEFAAIAGTVFEDLDTDGVFDDDEVGLPGVTVTLDEAQSAVTGPYGTYTFSTAVAGSHWVTETDPDGYISTTPNQVNLTVTPGADYEANFGDLQMAECQPDEYEEDDGYAQAQPIQPGADNSQTRNFCDDPVDWIAFNTQKGNTYTLATTSWGQRADTLLAIYGPDGQTMLMGNDDQQGTDNFSSQLTWQAPAAGTYYLQVSNRSGLTAYSTEYDVQLEAKADSGPSMLYLPFVVLQPQPSGLAAAEAPAAALGVINHMCPDAYEVDDTWEQAGSIAPGETQLHSFDSNPALYAADKDLVWFSLAKGETVAFHLDTVVNYLPVMELYDASGNALGVSSTNGSLNWQAEAGGRYYLSVGSLSMDFGCVDVAGYELYREARSSSGVIYLPLLTGSPQG